MKKKNRYVYPAILTYEDKGKIAITFPDLPGCASCGETDDEAIDCGREALGGHPVGNGEGRRRNPRAVVPKHVETGRKRSGCADRRPYAADPFGTGKSVSEPYNHAAGLDERASSGAGRQFFTGFAGNAGQRLRNPQIIQPEKRNEVRPSAEPPNPCGAEMRYVSAPAFLCTGNAGFFNHSKIFCLCNLLQFPTLFDDFLRFHELSAVRNIGCVAYNEIIGFAGYRCPDQRADR